MTSTPEREYRNAGIDILVAEDSPTQAQHLARLLRNEPGWRVHLVPDGVAALAHIRAAPPDLLISDVAMPGMDGYTLCRTLKQDPALAALPVLLLTSLSSLQDIVRALEAGADAFMRKPFDPDALRARVRHMLDGRRRGAAPDPALDFMRDERRHIFDLLVTTHEQALRLNAELDAQRASLARMCESLSLVARVTAALNEAVSADGVARAALDHAMRLPGLASVRLTAIDATGAVRELGARGSVDADIGPALTLPLEAGGKRLGTFALRCDRAALGDGEQRLLESVAKQIALALERAHLYASAEALVVERTAALDSERNRLATVVATTAALVVLTDPLGRIVMFNPACEEALGWPAAQALGRPCWEVVRGAEQPDLGRSLFAELLAAPTPQQIQADWRRRDGGVRCIIWTSTLIRDAAGAVEYALGTGIDVTELRGAEARLRYVSHHDTLTGLPNRALLRDRLVGMKTQVQDTGAVLGFMLLRFGRMPLIREALGPGAEQALLVEAGARLREAAAAGAVTGLPAAPCAHAVARFSEDAFAVAAPCRDAEALAALARRLLAVLGAPYRFEGEAFHLDPCLGIAVYPNDGVAYDTLAKGAESALRQATEGGGQRYAFYRPEFNDGANDRFKLEGALHRALERGEFEVHYQPQLALGGDADADVIVGAEALVRWRHPERGLIAPDSFIPLAEECGLILPLGEWVLRATCRQLRAWRDAGLTPVPVAVNLSAHQFSGEIVGTVRRALDEFEIDPGLLELELTESASMADADKSVALLAQLKAMGMRLAIDDFGTGYSNLNYLKRFPVDKLKLDRSFVRDLEVDGDDLAIAGAVIAMAHGLRLTVVAEGVETAGQLARLRGLGCDLVQGFLFSRAVPAAAFARMLKGRGQDLTSGPADRPPIDS